MEIPKNPNVRQPYSDVAGDLNQIQGTIVEFLGVSKAEMGHSDWERLQGLRKRLDWCTLRVRAILDPTSLTDDDWKTALGPSPEYKL